MEVSVQKPFPPRFPANIQTVSCSINCGLKFRPPEHLFEADDHDDQDAEPPKTTITVQHVPRTSAVQVGEIQAYRISSSNSLDSLASMGSSDSSSDDAVPYQCQPRFKPSRPRTGASRSASPKTIQQAALAGVDLSSRYQGGISDFNIKNAMCPGELNCAVRISNIPPEAEDKELFALINNGKVFSFNKNPPMPGVHPTSAADLSFTTREGAEGFMWRANQPSGIYLRGNRLRVFWNRNRCCPVPDSDRRQSRVVHIQGPADKISVDVLENYLQKFVVFQLVDGKEWLLNGGQKVVELSFGSIRGQSRCAFKCLLENFKDTSLDGLLGIRYGPDPCEPVQQSATHTSTN
jgi:hypothetical protein